MAFKKIYQFYQISETIASSACESLNILNVNLNYSVFNNVIMSHLTAPRLFGQWFYNI